MNPTVSLPAATLALALGAALTLAAAPAQAAEAARGNAPSEAAR